jgi:hypothetical protein
MQRLPPNFTVRPLQRLLSRRTIFTAATECGQADPASQKKQGHASLKELKLI